MSNDEYRAEQAERRQHGLKARHEQRLENATYTAAEVKVLTEAALRLGRKEALEEVAERCERRTSEIAASSRGLPMGDEWWTMTGLARGWDLAGKLALDLASQPSPDATSGRTDPPIGDPLHWSDGSEVDPAELDAQGDPQ